MVVLVCLATLMMLMSLVLGFLFGRNSMLKDLMKREDELVYMNELVCKMEQERDELRLRINELNKALLDDGK